jgi:branched-chain amino acid transport system permease protein
MEINWKKLTLFGVLVAAFLIAPLVIELGSNVMNLLVMLFILIILSQSWNMIGGYAGQINLGLAAFFGCGVLITHFVWKAGMPIFLASIAGGLAAAVLAGIIGLPTLRLKGAYFAIGTFALAEVCRIITAGAFTSIEMPGSYASSFSLVSRFYFGLSVAVIAIAVVHIIVNSKLGFGILAIRDDEQAAQVMGVNIFKHKIIALLVSAFLAGMAGGVHAFLRLSFFDITTVFNPVWTFEPLMAVIIGGAGTLIGPVIGSVFLVILSEIFALTLGQAHLIVFGFMFVLVVMYFRNGLVGSIDQIRQLVTRIN